jgi:hypothetical protein
MYITVLDTSQPQQTDLLAVSNKKRVLKKCPGYHQYHWDQHLDKVFLVLYAMKRSTHRIHMLTIIAFVLPSNALTKTVPHDVVDHHTML